MAEPKSAGLLGLPVSGGLGRYSGGFSCKVPQEELSAEEVIELQQLSYHKKPSEMSITIRNISIVMDKVKLIAGTSHDEKTSEDCTSYNTPPQSSSSFLSPNNVHCC